MADAARLVGKKVKVRVERVLDGTIYASLVGAAPAKVPAPIMPTICGTRRSPDSVGPVPVTSCMNNGR